jgi:hypothetical protein
VLAINLALQPTNQASWLGGVRSTWGYGANAGAPGTEGKWRKLGFPNIATACAAQSHATVEWQAFIRRSLCGRDGSDGSFE